MWNPDAPEGNEARKIKYEIVQYTRGRGLDLGCGPWKAFPHFIGVDSRREWGNGWKPDIEADCTRLDMFARESMDFVFSSHLLEHLDDPLATLKEWWRVLRVGGHLVLYLPHKDFYPRMGQPGANPDHRHDFGPEDVLDLMNGGWDCLVNERRIEGDEYSFLQVYRKRADRERNHAYKKRKPGKTVAVVRYGGFGDMIQASSVLPGLKEQGYHVTFFTTPRGQDILKADPHIDEFFIQDTDQVPNVELPAFWEVQSRKFDKWVNLSESVEGSLLALPGRTMHFWPKVARHRMMDENYLEMTHALAGVPLPPRQRFYATTGEKTWATRQGEVFSRGGMVVLWVLSGSAVHKVWPYLDNLIAKIMLELPNVKVVLAGDDDSRLLECGWENEPRVIRTCGKWSIRQTLAFAEVCDLVIGPETGVLNAVGMLDVPKIVTLSHSSIENLSKHWRNTISLEPSGCACYPCHMMHYGFEHCSRDEETGVAECQAKIAPQAMWDAITAQLFRNKSERAA